MKYRLLCLIILMNFISVGCASMEEFFKPVFSPGSKSDDKQHQYVKSDDAFDSVEGASKMPEAAVPAEQMKKSLMLGNAKRDLEAFRLYAKHLHQHNELDDLEIVEDATEAYIKAYVDDILDQEKTNPDYETIRLSVVILFTKAMLLYEFNQKDEVDGVMDELKTQYRQYYDIAVNHFGYEVIRDTIEKFEDMSQRKSTGASGASSPSGKKPGSTTGRPKTPSIEDEKSNDMMEQLDKLNLGTRDLIDIFEEDVSYV